MARREDLYLDVPCDTCQSTVGEYCTSGSGKVASRTHIARVNAFRMHEELMGTNGTGSSPVETGPLVTLSNEKDLANKLFEVASEHIKQEDNIVQQMMAEERTRINQGLDEDLESKERERKIGAVLWGIRFGREVMKMPQEQIDRNLAEMIVDNDLF